MKLVLVLLIAVLWSQLATTTIFKKKIFKHQPQLPPASYYRAAEAMQLTPSYYRPWGSWGRGKREADA